MNKESVLYFMGALPDPSLLAGLDGKIIGANSHACSYLRCPENTIATLGVEDFVPRQLREKHANLRNSFVQIAQQRRMGGSDGKYFPAMRHDESEVLCDISIGRIRLNRPAATYCWSY